MKLGLINSAWAQAGRDNSLGHSKNQGSSASTQSISLPIPSTSTSAKRCLIKRECDRLGLPIVSIACVATRGWWTSIPACSVFSIERVQAYLDLAYDYEARNVLLVLGVNTSGTG